jgi:hypothetical protein
VATFLNARPVRTRRPSRRAMALSLSSVIPPSSLVTGAARQVPRGSNVGTTRAVFPQAVLYSRTPSTERTRGVNYCAICSEGSTPHHGADCSTAGGVVTRNLLTP